MAEKYLVVQMGLSAFVWDQEVDDFKAHTWNIHVFPSDMVRVVGRSIEGGRDGPTCLIRKL